MISYDIISYPKTCSYNSSMRIDRSHLVHFFFFFSQQALRARVVEYLPKHPAVKSLHALHNKHLVMWSLAAGATGMFLGAAMAGIRANEEFPELNTRRTHGGSTKQPVRVVDFFKGPLCNVGMIAAGFSRQFVLGSWHVPLP